MNETIRIFLTHGFLRKWAQALLCVACMLIAVSCATRQQPSRYVDYFSISELNVHGTLRTIQRYKVERDNLLAIMGDVPDSVHLDATMARNAVYSDAQYQKDVDEFIELLILRIEALQAELKAYRDWMFRDSW